MFNIVLVEPRIPQNTGTIGRLCYAIGAKLHLIKPYGFEINEKALRRAGLDYWKDLEVYEYESLKDFWEKNQLDENHFLATTKTSNLYFEKQYKKDAFFYFGREDAGLPEELINRYPNQAITIPMIKEARSLNIANSVSIVAYEALKQNFESFSV
jgi:tRNA (cytidine/uridine-2'-O-)-methyltransferase